MAVVDVGWTREKTQSYCPKESLQKGKALLCYGWKLNTSNPEKHCGHLTLKNRTFGSKSQWQESTGICLHQFVKYREQQQMPWVDTQTVAQ